MYFYQPAFPPYQASSVSLQSAVARIGCVIPCEFALMHFCLLLLFRFSYLVVSEFS
jgi:hypothetical protein